MPLPPNSVIGKIGPGGASKPRTREFPQGMKENIVDDLNNAAPNNLGSINIENHEKTRADESNLPGIQQVARHWRVSHSARRFQEPPSCQQISDNEFNGLVLNCSYWFMDNKI
jgi:hypothetical protein